MTPTHEKILSRIRKLRAMTLANGCSETEANLALIKLAELMTEHGVSEAEVGRYAITSDFVELEYSFPHIHHNWTAVHRSIERLYAVKFYRKIEHDDLLGRIWHVTCFGPPVDVEAALAMSNICYSAILEAIAAQRVRTPSIPSFMMGMARRLVDRINDLIPAVVATPGTALVVANRALVANEFIRRNPDAGYSKASTVNHKAFAAGMAAGSNVRLGAHAEISATRRLR